MAIVFEKNLDSNYLLLSYNNNNVIFTQSSTTLIPIRAEIRFAGLNFKLFPDPDLKFFFNFKNSINTIINGSNNFADNTNLSVENLINYTNEIYRDLEVTYEIFYSNDTSDIDTYTYSFLSAYVNYQNKNYYEKNSLFLIKPIPQLKCWSGYPFDFTYYNGFANNMSLIIRKSFGTKEKNFFNFAGATNTPSTREFSTDTGSFTGIVGSNVVLFYNKPLLDYVLSSLSFGDTIEISHSSIGVWKYSIIGLSYSNDIWTLSCSVTSVGVQSSPVIGTSISTTFTLNNGLYTSQDFINSNKVNRFVVNDGNSNPLGLADGYNEITIGNNETVNSFVIENITSPCGSHYVKWLNSFGGWNYWLFNKGNETITTKDLGSINNDYDDVVDTVSPYIAIGKTSETTITLQQELITQKEMLILKDLLESPKVYLYTGIPYYIPNPLNWLEVNVKTGSFRVSNAKEKMNTLNIVIELPPNTTKTL